MSLSIVQSSVSQNPAVGRPGQLYDSNASGNRIVTRIASEAIPFGVWVTMTDNACELADNDGEVTGIRGGVAVVDETLASTVGYAAGDAVRILTRGEVYVRNEETIAANDAVYVRHTITGSEAKGDFRNDSDGGDASVAQGARWFLGGTANLAVLSVGAAG